MPLVLVVEDIEEIRVIAESILHDDGFETLTAANGAEALAVLRLGKPVDLLLTDVNMDPVDGIELATEARQIRPDVKVIYTSGRGATDGMRAMFVEGSSFLPKPYTAHDLLDAVAGLIGP